MIGPTELIFMILVYPLGAIFGAVMIGVGIALGLRWGGRWLLQIIYNDPKFEAWLKGVINASEKSE